MLAISVHYVVPASPAHGIDPFAASWLAFSMAPQPSLPNTSPEPSLPSGSSPLNQYYGCTILLITAINLGLFPITLIMMRRFPIN